MTQALYRRYRPDTFADVIGQEHVTEPLMQALRADKVTHAYLFSGPRGCGKTTSARILARCLNCAQGPTPEPCGRCDSCVDLARGGTGSLDVVEIDAASHGGVDDARDLRERATFAPARDRFKIFILDEAHMVTSQGFNALLKIVEEPPAHVKFIFATTEPDKVIGTIRSRTHHYPFRLVGPGTLQPYLEQICATEGVPIGSGVLPLVVRAGGGSVRDSLSVLDQLVAGAGAAGIDYERAVALLGYTHATLLDDVVDAIAARDGASAFRVVDRVVSSGHEPRRFVEDLLERLRDLIVIAASGEAAQAVLRDLPADQLERMRGQASVLGAAELSRSADLVNAALSEMTGATSPRLHLELLAARLLLPAADDGALGFGARLDRVERELRARGPVAGGVAVGAAEPVREGVRVRAVESSGPSSGVAPGAAAAHAVLADVVAEVSAVVEPPDLGEPPDEHEPPDDEPVVAEPVVVQPVVAEPVIAQPVAAEPVSAQPVAAQVPAAASGPAAGPVAPSEPAGPPGLDAEVVRRRWPEVLQTLRGLRMATWVLVSQNAQVSEVTPATVTLAFTTPQLATTFRTGPHAENVQRALHETLGIDVRIETALAESAAPARPPAPLPGATGVDDIGRVSASDAEASWTTIAATTAETPASDADTTDDPPPSFAAGREASDDEQPEAQDPGQPTRKPLRVTPAPAASRTSPRGRGGESAAPTTARRPAAVDDGDDADPDDPELASSGLVGAPLVAQMLGGTVIDEIPDDPR